MSDREQAKDADLAARGKVEAEQQHDPEAQAEGGLFGMPAMMQALELSGEAPEGSEVWNAETAQSADLLAHGGWSELEGGGGHGAAGEGEGGGLEVSAMAAAELDAAAEHAAAERAAAAEAELRAAVLAGQGMIEDAAAQSRAAITRRAGEQARALGGRCDRAIADLGRAAQPQGRALVGGITLAVRIADDGRAHVERAARKAQAEVDDAADSGSHALAAMVALHADRLRRTVGRSDAGSDGGAALAGALGAALAAVKRVVDGALRRMADARRALDVDLGEITHRAGDRLQRLVTDVRYAAGGSGSG